MCCTFSYNLTPPLPPPTASDRLFSNRPAMSNISQQIKRDKQSTHQFITPLSIEKKKFHHVSFSLSTFFPFLTFFFSIHIFFGFFSPAFFHTYSCFVNTLRNTPAKEREREMICLSTKRGLGGYARRYPSQLSHD